jgi:hypothetical protein
MLLSDGSAAFGVQSLTATVDTTASGVDDVQVVRVVQGPANLYIKTTTFSDGFNVWELGINRAVPTEWCGSSLPTDRLYDDDGAK